MTARFLHSASWRWRVLRAGSVLGAMCAVMLGLQEKAPPAPATQPAAAPPGTHQQGGSFLGPPPVQFEPAQLDLGVVRPGGKANGVVMIHNLSDRWLLIKASRASCTCTAVNLANTSIGPGQAVPMDVAYHASSVTGEKKAAVRVLFEGYDVIEVPIVADVAMTVRTDPTYIDALMHDNGKQTLSGQFTVYAADHKPFRVLSVNGKPPVFADFNPQADTPRDTYALRWDLTGYDEGTCKNADGERLPGFIVVETDHPDAPLVDLEVRHMCNLRNPPTAMDTWALQEKRISLGAVKPGESVDVEVEAKWIPRRDKVEPPRAVASESPLFSIELLGTTPTEGGFTVKLRVTIAKDARGFIYAPARVHSNRQAGRLGVVATVRE